MKLETAAKGIMAVRRSLKYWASYLFWRPAMDLESVVTSVLTVLIPIYVTSFLIYVVRVVKGPTLPDRVLAVDSLGYDLAAFMVVLSVLLKSPLMVVCGLALALWIYALDIYVAKFLEAKEMGG